MDESENDAAERAVQASACMGQPRRRRGWSTLIPVAPAAIRAEEQKIADMVLAQAVALR